MHKFSYDPSKAEANLRKHGVSLADAQDVFGDPLALTKLDPDSPEEERLVTIGLSSSGILLIVVSSDRDGVYRLISARKATRKERKAYEG